MDLKYRRIIYIGFIALFAVAAVVLLLYAQGYKYNKLKGRIEKTGAITVESVPAGAPVRITQQTATALTPLNWSRLAPDEYEVTVQLDGFQTWTKKLSVKSGQVTQTGKIKLWPNEQAGTLLPDTSRVKTWLAPNRQNLLFLSNQGLGAGLWLHNLASGDSALISRPAADKITYLEWSPSSRQILLNVIDAGWQITNLTDNTTTAISLPATLSPKIMHWSADDNSVVYFATATELYEFDLGTNSAKLLSRDQIIDFQHHQGLLYLLSEQNKGGVALKILNPKNLQEVPLTEPLPLSTDYVFLEQSSNWLPLLDSNRHQLYLLRSPLKNFRSVTKIDQAINIDWSQDANKIIFYNNFEVWSYNFDTEQTNLLYRVSSVINQARWYNDQYVLLNTGGQLVALELDSRDHQQSWVLSTQDQSITDLFIEPQSKVITMQTQNGLIRLLVTEGSLPAGAPPANSPATEIQTSQHLSTNL